MGYLIGTADLGTDQSSGLPRSFISVYCCCISSEHVYIYYYFLCMGSKEASVCVSVCMGCYTTVLLEVSSGGVPRGTQGYLV